MVLGIFRSLFLSLNHFQGQALHILVYNDLLIKKEKTGGGRDYFIRKFSTSYDLDTLLPTAKPLFDCVGIF